MGAYPVSPSLYTQAYTRAHTHTGLSGGGSSNLQASPEAGVLSGCTQQEAHARLPIVLAEYSLTPKQNQMLLGEQRQAGQNCCCPLTLAQTQQEALAMLAVKVHNALPALVLRLKLEPACRAASMWSSAAFTRSNVSCIGRWLINWLGIVTGVWPTHEQFDCTSAELFVYETLLLLHTFLVEDGVHLCRIAAKYALLQHQNMQSLTT